MQRKQIRLIGSCLAIVLMAALASVMPACSSTSTWTPTPTPTLTMVSVEPLYPPNLAVGSTLQFKAIGNYSKGLTADITSQVTWTSDNTKVATISSTGLATGVAVGTANITAVMSGLINPPVTLTVVAPKTTSTTTTAVAP